jgi:hypothetical protein
MFDWLTVFPENARLVAFLFAVLGSVGAVISTTTVLAVQWRRVRQAELEAGLKQDMLQRGMSAYEIAAVVRATAGETGADQPERAAMSMVCR